MYQPAHFVLDDPARLKGLMRDHPLATLVAQHAEGMEANHLPLYLAPAPDSAISSWEGACLYGHVARANPLADLEGAPVLAIFHGPQAYVSPNWYPGKAEHGRAVPTWNYAVVHVHGRLRCLRGAEALQPLLDTLTRQQEDPRAEPWQMADAPADYLARMMDNLVGLTVTIERVEGKAKMSQNQPPANRAGVLQGLKTESHAGAWAVADWMARG